MSGALAADMADPAGSAVAGRPGALRVAYLTGRYPEISHAFIIGEVRAVRDRGIAVETFSIWRTARPQLLSRADREEFERTYAMLPPRLGQFARAHVAAAVRAPRAWMRIFTEGVRLGAAGVRGRALGVLWAAEAILLWHQCRRRGIRHIHVHINGTAPAVALLCARFGRAADGEPWSYTMTVHGSNEFYDVVRERLVEKVAEARAVVCVSDFTRSQLMRVASEEHWPKLQVVHCGVDPGAFDVGRLPARREPAAGRLRVLVVARLVQGKGHALMLEAMAGLAGRGVDVHADVVGDGPKRIALERIAVELGIAQRVTFLGSIGQDDIREQYRRADVFCLPSFAEGVPVVLMEAMAMGLPVVASALMGIPELVEHGVSGFLVRPGRADELQDALAAMAADPALRAAMGGAARRRVLEAFSVERSARELERIFRDAREFSGSNPAATVSAPQPHAQPLPASRK
jgi:glycosyltransferase involved in cell wall biosynthesis